MQVTFKLYAQLGQYLPPHADRNQVALEVPEGTSVWDVIDAHNVPRGACHLVLLNGHYQAPDVRGTVHLKAGDALAVWPPIAGG
jgi:Mut7-C ubiquitin